MNEEQKAGFVYVLASPNIGCIKKVENQFKEQEP